MNLLSILFPQTIYKTASGFSGEIKVIDHVFERRLVVGGLTQSGGIVKGMWGKALRELRAESLEQRAKNVLILGLGAGTVAEVINDKWPEAKIVGIEIDPTIIDVGKKYFHLDGVKNLDIVLQDAIVFVNYTLDAKRYALFDVIIVDLYKGFIIEKNIKNNQFLQKIAKKLSKNGIVIFNVVRLQNDTSEADVFLDKLAGIFKDKFCKRIIVNDFFFCMKPRQRRGKPSP